VLAVIDNKLHSSDGKFSHYRGMIRRSLQPAWFFIYPASGTDLGQRWTDQDEVEAQTEIATEGGQAVIPPAETGLCLVKQPKSIDQTQFQQTPQCHSLGFAAQYLSLPGFGIVNITIFRCDVEITEDY
jgi:hypothetical protein